MRKFQTNKLKLLSSYELRGLTQWCPVLNGLLACCTHISTTIDTISMFVYAYITARRRQDTVHATSVPNSTVCIEVR